MDERVFVDEELNKNNVDVGNELHLLTTSQLKMVLLLFISSPESTVQRSVYYEQSRWLTLFFTAATIPGSKCL